MAWLFLGVALLLGGLLLLRWFLRAEPRQVALAVRWGALAVGVVVAVVLLATGRFGLLWTALIFLTPLLARMRLWRNLAQAARGPSPGKTSEVHTRFVTMRLDHDTGAMDGEVRQGPYAGQLLSALRLEQVLEVLRQAMHEDMRSVQVLEAYLDRAHGPDWRAGAKGGTGAGRDGAGSAGQRRSSGPMSRDEAYAILGLSPSDGPEAVKRAHRRLMQQYHPDRGGSDYLAAKINEAKDILLGR